MILSIIIPMFNSQNTIKRAIDSCLESLAEIEIILVDDGSTDSTIRIIKKYYQKLISSNIIQIINSGHRGAGNARNVGLNKAVGKWIIFLDSDDKFVNLRRVLSDIKNEREQNCIDIISYTKNPLIWNNKSQKKIIVNGKRLIKDNLGLSNDSKKYWDSGPVNKVYRKSFLKKHGIYFATDVKIGEDLIFNQKCLLLNPSVLVIHEYVYKIITNQDSVTHIIVKQDILSDAVSLIEKICLLDIPYLTKEEFIAKNYIAVLIRFLKRDHSVNDIINDLKLYKYKFTIKNSLIIFLKIRISLNLIKSLTGWLIWVNPNLLKVLYPLIKRIRY